MILPTQHFNLYSYNNVSFYFIDHIFLKGYHPSINQHLITVIIILRQSSQLNWIWFIKSIHCCVLALIAFISSLRSIQSVSFFNWMISSFNWVMWLQATCLMHPQWLNKMNTWMSGMRMAYAITHHSWNGMNSFISLNGWKQLIEFHSFIKTFHLFAEFISFINLLWMEWYESNYYNSNYSGSIAVACSWSEF